MKVRQVVFLCILCLFIGSISTIFVAKQYTINTSDEIKSIIYSQLNSNIRFIDVLYDRIMNIDTNLYGVAAVEECNNIFYFYRTYQAVREDILKNKKTNTISYRQFFKYIENRICILQSDSCLLNVIKSVKKGNLSKEEKLFRIDIIMNQILHEYLLYNHTHAIPAYGKVINYANKDTVKIGEIYQSKIFFEAFGFGNNLVIMENGDTLKDYIFKEKPLKIGDNHRKGYYTLFTENGFAVYEVNINYYVK
jgi:hypothetical protein